MQNLGDFGIEDGFFFSTLLRVLWEGISSSINFAFIIIDLKIIPWQFLSIPDLSKAQAFCIYEVVEVTIVR